MNLLFYLVYAVSVVRLYVVYAVSVVTLYVVYAVSVVMLYVVLWGCGVCCAAQYRVDLIRPDVNGKCTPSATQAYIYIYI